MKMKLMHILGSILILLGLLVTAGCGSGLAQWEDVSPTPEAGPTVTPQPESPDRAPATPESEPAQPEGTAEVPEAEGASEADGDPAAGEALETEEDLEPEVTTTPDRSESSMRIPPERVPPTERGTPVTGEVPTLILTAIVQELAARTETAPEEIGVTRDQAVVWSDGSLGCPQPGVMYTQALVDGYWVELEVDGRIYDYRAARTGHFILCENGRPPPTPPVARPDR